MRCRKKKLGAIKLTDFFRGKMRKIKIFLRIQIEKNTRCGIITLRLADTESTGNGAVIISFSWEIGEKADCNLDEKELTDYEVHNQWQEH